MTMPIFIQIKEEKQKIESKLPSYVVLFTVKHVVAT